MKQATSKPEDMETFDSTYLGRSGSEDGEEVRLIDGTEASEPDDEKSSCCSTSDRPVLEGLPCLRCLENRDNKDGREGVVLMKRSDALADLVGAKEPTALLGIVDIMIVGCAFGKSKDSLEEVEDDTEIKETARERFLTDEEAKGACGGGGGQCPSQ